MPPAAQLIAMIGLLAAVPAACAFVLRQAGAPGWSVLGGVLAGLLLGPTLFGRIAPPAYEAIIVGGIGQREALDRVVSRQGADVLAAEAAGLDAAAFDQLRQTHAQERARLEEELNEARWAHQQPMRILAAILTVVALLGASGLDVPKSPASGGEQRGQHILSAINIGLWCAILPGALAYIAATRWWGWTPAESAIVAAAVMIGPWALTRIDREAADQAEHGGAPLIQAAGRFASILAIAAAAWAFFVLMGFAGLAWAAALGAIVIGWMLPANEKDDYASSSDGRHPRLSAFICGLIVPTLAALAAIRIDLFSHFAIWPILVLLILSGDGRWLGAFIGAMTLGGRSGLRTMRLVLGSMASGPTQLAVVALAANLWIMPHQAIMALVLGAVLIEVSAPLRRSMASRLTEAEEWELH